MFGAISDYQPITNLDRNRPKLTQLVTVDFRADIYAFGIILYEMVTGGGYPYALKSFGEDDFVSAHLRSNPVKINSEIYPIIERCLAKNPKDRYESYNDFLADINDVSVKMGFYLQPESINSIDDEAEEIYNRAQGLDALGRHEEALTLISQYNRRFPENSVGWTQRGRILVQLNRIEEAEKALLQSAKLFPYGSPVWNNLGLVYKRQQRYDEAFQAFHNALVNDPGNSGAMMNCALAYFDSKQYSLCADMYITALDIYPKKETLLFNASNSAPLIAKDGDSDSSIRILRKLTEVNPNHVNNWFNLALICWQMKYKDECVKCFETVIRLDPNDQFSVETLAKLKRDY